MLTISDTHGQGNFQIGQSADSVNSHCPTASKLGTPSSNPAPPLQNHMFSLEKRGFVDDSGDSQDDSPGSKAAHKTTQHLQAWTCMDRQESQSNWPEMRKTLEKPGFLSGEDRIRTCGDSIGETRKSAHGGAESGARIEIVENTRHPEPHTADWDLAFIIDAWPLLGPQAKSQMIAISRAARQGG